MNKEITVAVIVTRSILLADGLAALLGAIPQIDEVKIARNVDEAVAQIESLKPRIGLIDSVGLGNRPTEVLEKIVLVSPETQRLLLVDGVQEVKWMPKYAEAVLIKGVSPSAVATIVTNLLFPKGE